MVTVYTPEVTAKLVADYQAEVPVSVLAEQLGVPERSVRAKLASLQVYKKKPYLNKQGLPPVRKSEYIERIADLLGVPPDRLESLEKVNKGVLILIEEALQ